MPRNIMFRYLLSHCRKNPYFILGLCLGISLNLMFNTNLIEDCTLPGNIPVMNERQGFLLNSHNSDDYEPRINLAGKPLKAQKTPQLLIRPRYYSTELGIREKLFVGVLTSHNTIATQGVAFNKTVSHLVDKVMFFIDAPGPQKLNISMPGIVGFTDTRQILKPFHMLKYITDNYLDEFDFFYLVKDTTYVKARWLYEMVLGTSVSENVHVGSGKEDRKSAFCSLDAGLLLSNSVMKKVLSNLDWCVKNAFSDSDSVNVGRCIVHATGVECQDSVQGQKFTSYRLSEKFTTKQNIFLDNDARFNSAFSIYPVLEPLDVFKLHSYFCKVELTKTKAKVGDLRMSITNTSTLAPEPNNKTSWPIGNRPGDVPNNRFDVLRWDHFTQTHIYLDTDFTNKRELQGATLKDIKYVLDASILRLTEDYNGQYEFRRLLNGYKRFDPSRGMDYILDIALKDKTTGREVHKRMEVCKPLGNVEVIPMPYVTENSRVSLILPIHASRKTEAKIFIEKYQAIMEKRDKTFLMLVLLYEPTLTNKGETDIYSEIKSLALALSEKYKRDGSKIAWVSIKLPQTFQTINSQLLEIALIDMTVRKFNPDSLILMAQTNMELRQDFLNRVRMNTILGWQVFSPIPFSEFDPSIVYNSYNLRPNDLDINKTYGHFDSKSTVHMAFYAADYLTARKSIIDSVPMIKYDRELSSMLSQSNYNGGLYEMFVRWRELHVFRATEPGLRLRHTPLECSLFVILPSLYKTCVGNRNFNLGTRSQLAKIILDYKSQRQ